MQQNNSWNKKGEKEEKEENKEKENKEETEENEEKKEKEKKDVISWRQEDESRKDKRIRGHGNSSKNRKQINDTTAPYRTKNGDSSYLL
jgi:hypothetical protein